VAENYHNVWQHATGLGKAGSVAGSLIGGMADPVVLGGSLLGGIGLLGRGIGIGRGMAIETGIGMGIETLATPFVMEQMHRAQEDYTLTDAIFNITLSGVGSGALYGAIRGSGRGIRFLTDRAADVSPDTRAFIDWLDRANIEGHSGPIVFGDRFTTARHFNDIDRSTSALITGQLLPTIEADISRIRYQLFETSGRQLRTFEEGIPDPRLRQIFRETADELRMSMRQQLTQSEQAAIAASRGPEVEAARTRLTATQDRVQTISEQITELDSMLRRFRSDDPQPTVSLSNFVSDDAAALRLRSIDDELGRPGIRARERRALQEEARLLTEEHRADIEANIEAEIDTLTRELDTAGATRIREFDDLRQTSEFRRYEDGDNQAVMDELVRKRGLLNEDALTLDSLDPRIREFYPDTPVRVGFRNMASTAEASTERTIQRMPEIVQSQEVRMRTQAEETPDAPVQFTDIDTGQVRQTTLRQALAELDEERTFLEEFRRCRIG
jgi:hypothetical protein